MMLPQNTRTHQNVCMGCNAFLDSTTNWNMGKQNSNQFQESEDTRYIILKYETHPDLMKSIEQSPS
jgi:hypothetical protein